MGRFFASSLRPRLFAFAIVLFLQTCTAFSQASAPTTYAIALDGHAVTLPRDLSDVTVVIVGFTKASADATTAWEIPVRTHLVNNHINLYDLAILESAPGFVHNWILRSLQRKVPPILKPRFLPVFEHEKEWKQTCDFDPKNPDAAYLLLTNREGKIFWKTHEAYTAAGFTKLQAEAGKWQAAK